MSPDQLSFMPIFSGAKLVKPVEIWGAGGAGGIGMALKRPETISGAPLVTVIESALLRTYVELLLVGDVDPTEGKSESSTRTLSQ